MCRYSLKDFDQRLPQLPAELPVLDESISSCNGQHRSGSSNQYIREITYLATCEPSISGKGGHDRLMYAARILVYGFNLSITEGMNLLLTHFNPRCKPRWSEKEIRHKCNEADTKPFDKPRGWLLNEGASKFTRPSGHKGPSRKTDADNDSDRPEPFSDLWNARKMVSFFRAAILYVATWEKWLTWDGHRWKLDEDGQVMLFAKATADKILEFAENEETDKKKKKRARSHALKSANAARLKAMIELASTEPRIPVLMEQLNQHSFLLNCTNGTLDLRTGMLRTADRPDLITQLCPIAYDPAATCPRWLAFLDEIMGGNRELVDYLARAVGYALTGSVREHALFFCFGTGSNGKGVFLRTLQTVFGKDYAIQAKDGLLLAKQGDSHPTELADLYGIRLAINSETDEGRRWDESLLKQTTGGDRIRARRMRQDFWEFSPTHKFWIAGNHKPRIRGQDEGIWRRIHLIPFQVTFQKDKQDPQLESILASEAMGILAWAVKGCTAWQREGLNPPSLVVEATAGYRKEQDVLGSFFDECAILGDTHSISSSTLLDGYSKWLGKGKQAPTPNSFATMMEAKGFIKKRSTTTGRSMWQGITIQSDFLSDFN